MISVFLGFFEAGELGESLGSLALEFLLGMKFGSVMVETLKFRRV